MSWPYEDDDEGRVYGEQETSYHPGSYASTNATRLRAHTFRPGRGERSFIVDAPPVAVPWASLPSHRTWEPRQRPRRVSDPAYGRGYDDFDGRPHPDELGVPVPSSGRLDPRNVHAPPKTPSHHRDDGPTPHRAPARPEKGKPAKMADPDPTEPYDEKVAFQPTSHHHSRFSHHHHHPQQYAAPRRHASVVIEDPNDPTHELTAEDLTRTQSPSRSSSVPKVPRLSREGRDDEALRVDHFADAHGTEKKASGDHVQEAHQPLSWRHLVRLLPSPCLCVWGLTWKCAVQKAHHTAMVERRIALSGCRPGDDLYVIFISALFKGQMLTAVLLADVELWVTSRSCKLDR